MHLTSGYELTTSITNIFIFIMSIYGFLKIKKDKKWKLFFLFMAIDSFLRVIVHGFVMSIQLNVVLWIMLSAMFTITINTLLAIFLKFKIRYIIILSVLFIILIITQIYFGFNFILTFALYVLLAMILSVYFIIKDNIKNKKYFLLGFLFQLIGGLFMLSKIKLPIINHNGIYHIFMTITLIYFYIGANKYYYYNIK